MPQPRHGGEQLPRVGIGRLAQGPLHGPALDDAAVAHDEDRVRHGRDDPDVVRDEHDRRAEELAQASELVERLPLDCDVERARGLVGEQHRRARHHRDRDAGPLVHAARELEGIALPDALAVLEAELGEQVERPRADVARTRALVGPDGLDNLVADRADRAQRGARVLEDHADLRAPDAAELALGQVGQVAPAKPDVTARHEPRIAEQAERGPKQGALATAGLPHDAENLAGGDTEAHVVHDGLAVEADLDRVVSQHLFHGRP